MSKNNSHYISPYKIYGSLVIFLAVLIFGFAFYYHLNLWVAYFLAVNLITFVFYFYDKIISNSRLTRVPEIIFHLLAIFGGSPMALLAQKMFRHKTIKPSFQMIYWLIVIGQILLAVFFANELK